MSALLVWALRFVENFSDDILTAKTMKSAPHQVSANLAVLSPQERFNAYLRQRQESGTARVRR